MKTNDLKETNLGDFISRIKQEGVEEASRLGDEIIREARQTAEEIVREAKKEGQAILSSADAELEKREEKAKRSMELALRDSLLQLRNSIENLFDNIIKREYGSAIKGDVLEEALLKVIEAWKTSPDARPDMELFLSEKDRKGLLSGFMARLKQDFCDDIELKVHPDIKAGFRVGGKGSDMQYEFTDEALGELLSLYLKDEFRNILNQKSME